MAINVVPRPSPLQIKTHKDVKGMKRNVVDRVRAGNAVVVQEMPPADVIVPLSFQTTCMHICCSTLNHSFEPSTDRASIELKPTLESTDQPYTPMMSISKINSNPRYHKFFGKAVEDRAWWFHLECFKELLDEGRGFIQAARFPFHDPGTTFFAMRKYFVGEFRGKTCASSNWNYGLPSQRIQGLEEWKASTTDKAWPDSETSDDERPSSEESDGDDQDDEFEQDEGAEEESTTVQDKPAKDEKHSDDADEESEEDERSPRRSVTPDFELADEELRCFKKMWNSLDGEKESTMWAHDYEIEWLEKESAADREGYRLRGEWVALKEMYKGGPTK